MPPLALLFLAAAAATAILALLFAGRMARQLKQSGAAGPRASLLQGLPAILREHHRSFPQSGPMLAFWLSIIFLIVWLACLATSLVTHL